MQTKGVALMGSSHNVRRILVAAILGYLALLSTPAWAEWTPALTDTHLPPRFILVDKETQRFVLLARDAETKGLTKLLDLPCTTGKMPGDKERRLDNKTPEGIYFVQKFIPGGLDFREYGGLALTLDYPNPVDVLRKKTGGGIWIHSKGYGLVPTRGCVAIPLADLKDLGPKLAAGTPVLITASCTIPTPLAANETAERLRKRMRAWAQAWANRDHHLFDFYNKEAYSRTTEPFADFSAKKQRIFAKTPISLTTADITALEGPGYWVTYAKQRYKSPNHASDGIRILYWMPDTKGRYTIVGMKWLPQPKTP